MARRDIRAAGRWSESSPRARNSHHVHLGSPLGRASMADSGLWPRRFMECFAAYLSYTDEQIGRVLDFIDDLGDADNTVVDRRLGQWGQLRGWQGGHYQRGSALETSKAPAWARCTGGSTRSADRSATTTTRGDGPWPATRRSSAGSARSTRAGVADPCIVRAPLDALRRPERSADSTPMRSTSSRRCSSWWVSTAHEIDGDRPVAPRRHELRLRARRGWGARARPAPDPALRDARVAGHLPRRLEGGDLSPGRSSLR